ncbi:MAG: imidazole glycerol phosphate synthase subunit HisH [Cohaesibacter sp.]|jgi:glutamine amidotransferase|nr:imidazole glycerol phosphate synthase subunit HisH [Cohaesibacter sp.]
MSSTTLIDYGIGNLLSVERALHHVGADLKIATTAQEIQSADRLLLPGVGAFSSCVNELSDRGLMDAIREFAASGRPLLGICVGMQMLFEASEEFGETAGFGFIKGRVKAIPSENIDGVAHKIPHIGWSPLLQSSQSSWHGTILHDVPSQAEVYFVHSFRAVPEDEENCLAATRYGGHVVTAAVQHDNIYGTQFHPEKSGKVGLSILQKFITL